ncbi:MAG: M1 family metallopeptidase [Saprospiraceae bacterium]|nr:M1 family metallopeptidase [Saprospiraceae bacterium]
MKNNFITVFLLLIFQFAFGQGYFQQQVNYDIKVSLNDKKQVAQATVLIDYHNNSSKTLKEIKFHFWANAHQSQNASPLAKQLVEKDKLDWYFAKDDALGGYSNIEILYQNNKIEWTFEDESKEICTVKLPEELLPKKTIQLKINYQLKIPFLISRLGHVKNEYAISQWYPKPAVYNQNGWNTMPYLDQGEFFSEFGNYEVDITLPENYVVAATGTLQTESEKKWLSKIAKEQTEERMQRVGSKEITASPNLKTIHFSAQNVHDFAWFASKRFIVDQSKLTLNKDKTIEVNSFYYPESAKVWQHSNGFAQRAIQYFSEEIGEYPYPQISVVNGDLKAGGGMEYPMITLISDTPDSQSLDQIIAHELAHNWFYGILASNERKYPWMDEGFTSFYEQKYMKAFYKNSIGQFPPFFHNKGDFSDNQIFQRLLTYQNKEESGSLSSEEFSRLGYLNAAYSKPAISLELLEGKMGEANFKKAIQHYYNIWQFKHPYPEDCKLALEKGSGQNLDWLFYDLLQSNKRTDVSIQKVSNNGNNWKINLRNNGKSKIPIPISFFSKNELKKTIWLEPFVKDTTFEIDDFAANKVIIDAEGISTDCNSNNNYFNSNQIFKKCLPWKVSMLPKVANPTHNNLFLTPIPAYNSNDQFMVGVAMYKDFIPSKNWETYLMPLYSFKTNSLVGMAGAEHFWYLTKSVFQKINIGADYQSFHYNTDQSYGYFDRYQRLHSWIEATVDSKNSIWNFGFNNTLINQNYGEGIDIATKNMNLK